MENVGVTPHLNGATDIEEGLNVCLSHLYLPRQLSILIQDNLIHYTTLTTPDFDSEMMNCKMALRCHIKRLENTGSGAGSFVMLSGAQTT
ncbi:hypothetical protein DV515_00008719 [Chloebia gouldiae]|uniref:Uncharacterized protein n=1 Tax=Chloebia gouldiae TaxID=44316 RepID=A0A3L8SFU1_CHLGU|nr:hypothetical protein DV515_00008719 [Chloebia gouldiae]